MSREISNDAKTLILFLENFNLQGLLTDSRYLNQLKSMHKKCYGFLLFITEVEQQNLILPNINEFSLTYLKETASDLIQAIFSWATGAYKAANITLRSSIETFIKAILGNDYDEIFDEKSVYKIFERACLHNYFLGEVSSKKFNIIHAIYKELCMIAHSAKTANLGTISSLNFLPRYNHQISLRFNALFLKLLDSMLSIFLINMNDILNKMHPLNKDVFLSSIALSTKKEIFSRM